MRLVRQIIVCTESVTSSPSMYPFQHSRTFAFSAAISGNVSGTKFLEGPSGNSPFLPEPLQLRGGTVTVTWRRGMNFTSPDGITTTHGSFNEKNQYDTFFLPPVVSFDQSERWEAFALISFRFEWKLLRCHTRNKEGGIFGLNVDLSLKLSPE
ncbi:hypothetical protein TNCV_2206471 [Trichonephila clavipes]|uniref:Uncharacterized protein n=1 Tax=Trichonephila clavipes TaxID=2585209 RepID=A0A8X6S2F0_TRICX|nr:hypothetical protein TNCV_2206471 [Trichonephila clavipes]